MKRQTKKASERRKTEREGYADFFLKHAEIARKRRTCDNCGAKLVGHVSEVAHILPKQVFKSVATNDNNVVYLGSAAFSNCTCHDEYDSSWSKAKKMPVWKTILDKYLLLKGEVEETHLWKILNHFDN